MNVTQGDLIISTVGGNSFFKAAMDKKWIMEGEKSEQGIVVNKLVGNATKTSDLSRS
ncbi:hypothetical protein [Neobacillus niacini]|uniref:hypothetical protein n=1 Tax=Neobacillus niacini TaxID=86668 RepID=UPI0030007A7C